MSWIAEIPAKRSAWVIGLVFVLSLYSLHRIVDLRTGELRLSLDVSLDSMIPADSEGRRYYRQIAEQFGSDDTILIVLGDDDIFTAANLERVERISERIERLDVVHHVTSLATALNIKAEAGELSIEPFLDEVPEDETGLLAIRHNALTDPTYAGNLVSLDGRATAISVHPLDMSDRELMDSRLDESVRQIVLEEAGEIDAWITGSAHVKAELSSLLFRDLTRVIPLCGILIFLVGWGFFRRLRPVVLSMLVIGIGVLWVVACIAATTGQMNQATISVPAILMVVGYAYAVHVVSSYDDVLHQRAIVDQGERPVALLPDPAAEALAHVMLPVVLTGITTAAGFLSLATSRIDAIVQFGTFSALGVVITTLLSITLIPALQSRLGPPSRLPDREEFNGDWLDRLLMKLADFDLEHRRLVLLGAVAFAIIAVLGTTRINVNTDLIKNFHTSNPVRQDFEVVNRVLEGSNGFYVVVEGDRDGVFLDPENLAQLDRLQHWMEEEEEIGGSTSFADYLKVINRGFHDNDPNFYDIPSSRNLVSQLLILGANDEFEQYIDSGYRVAKIAVRTTAIDSAEVNDLVERVEERLADLPRWLTGRVTGNTVLLSRTMDDIALGQAISLSSAFAIIFLILASLFTSLRIGLIAMVPNALPVLAYFGILGWSGVDLNVTTGLVACMVLGIAVDDTVHYLTHYNRAARAAADESFGAHFALRDVGRPITMTTVALCLGFMALSMSELRNQANFGVLSATTLALAWLVDVTVTPALAANLGIVTLWDVLTLNLGDHPEKTIPLFRGMTVHQARIVALMTSLRTIPKDSPLSRRGDMADEMYVVIDGTLRVNIAGESGPVHLRTHQRGDIVGEVGLFEGHRTADVDTVTEVRLLCLTQASLDRLRKRYPRTGAMLYRNIAAVLASRLDDASTRVK